MTVSDIITLVSLIIAIVAILNSKNRQHLLLKFHVVDYILFTGAFISINYFVFYDNFYTKGIYIKSLYFQNWGFGNPKNYAYLIAIINLIYFFYKILYAFYPNNKKEKVINFYKRLIEENEISFLLDLIDKYHKKDIIKRIQRIPDYNPESHWWEERFHKNAAKEELYKWFVKMVQFLVPYSWYNRRSYGISVLHNVINDPAFIVLASNQRPYLFAEIFAHFKKIKQNGFPDELVNSFITELLYHKNFWLKKELKQSQNIDNGQPDWFHDENKILSALLKDLSVAEVNEIWRPFGEIAVDEIEEERTKGYESKMFQVYRDGELLWEYKTYFSIQFFNILIVEALVKKYTGSHFWLYYYRSIVDEIITTFKKYPPNSFEEVETVYHKLIDIMVSNLFSWLDISNEKETKGFYQDILVCLGSIIHTTFESPYFGEKRKIEILKWLLSSYCNLKDNSEIEKIRTKIESILLKPSMLTDSTHPYYLYIKLAWEKFDRVQYRTNDGMGEDCDFLKRLKEKVIIPLGLDPDIY